MVDDWTARAARRLAGGAHPPCAAAHTEHESVVTRVVLGGQPMVPDYPPIPGRWGRIWFIEHADAGRYANTRGYCPGDSEVARALAAHGIWEGHETLLAMSILDTQPSIVVDFGANIGWYTLLAASFGHRVLAIEAEPTYLRWLRANLDRNGFDAEIAAVWIDERTPRLDAEAERIRLVKIDLEGAEDQALRVVAALLDSRLIDYLLVEVTPSFGWGAWRVIDTLRANDYALYRMPDKGSDPEAFAADPLAATLAQPLATLGDEQITILASA